MALTNAEYRRRVFMTLSQKPAKDGIRRLAQNQKQVNAYHGVVGISTEVGELFKALKPFGTGAAQLNDDMRKQAFEEIGDILYYVFVVAKITKAKLPTLTKKVKIKGTMTEALWDLQAQAGDMLDMVKKQFYGPQNKAMLDSEGQTVLDAKGQAKQVFDKVAQQAKYDERNGIINVELDKFVHTLWGLIYALFGEVPQVVAAGNAAKLAKRYPDGFFDKAAQEDRDTEKELDAMEEGAAAEK